MSYSINLLANVIQDMPELANKGILVPVQYLDSGFKLFKAEVVNTINDETEIFYFLQGKAYSKLIQLYKLKTNGFRLLESITLFPEDELYHKDAEEQISKLYYQAFLSRYEGMGKDW